MKEKRLLQLFWAVEIKSLKKRFVLKWEVFQCIRSSIRKIPSHENEDNGGLDFIFIS